MAKTKVHTVKGLVHLTDPETGEVLKFSKEDAKEALAAGFIPATEEATVQKSIEDIRGSALGQFNSLTQGVYRGATLGGSDIAYNLLGQGRRVSEERTVNPITSGIGEVAGAAGSMALPIGPLAGLAGGAERVGSRIATGLGGSPMAAAAGTLAREGLIGTGIGAGEGISQIALSPEEMGIGEQIGLIGKQAAIGGIAGLGASAIGLGLGAGIRAAKRIPKLSLDDVKNIRQLRKERDLVVKELEAVKANRVKGQTEMFPDQKISELEGKLANIAADLGQKHADLAKGIAGSAITYGIGTAIGGGGGALGVLVGGRAVKLLSPALKPLSGKVEAVARAMKPLVAPASRMAKLGAIEIATPAPEQLTPVLARKLGADRDLQDEAVQREAIKEIAKTSDDDLRLAVQLRTGDLPSNLADEATDSYLKAAQYIKGQMPEEQSMAIVTGKQKTSEIEQSARNRRISAITKPISLLESFASGRLQKDQVDAWQQVYPEALAQLRQVVDAVTSWADSQGLKYTRKQAQQIALLKGDTKLAPRLYDPQVINQLQEMHAASMAEPNPVQKRNKLQISRGYSTPLQRIRGGDYGS